MVILHVYMYYVYKYIYIYKYYVRAYDPSCDLERMMFQSSVSSYLGKLLCVYACESMSTENLINTHHLLVGLLDIISVAKAANWKVR